MFSFLLVILFFINLNFSEYILYILNFFILIFLFFLQIVFFTTCERKILALTQRRVGPNVVGDRGRLQYIADALKLVLKVYFSPKKVNNLFFQGSSVFIFYVSWLNYLNINYTYGEDIGEIEYNIFFSIVCSLGFSCAWLVAGWSSTSKYAILGTIRAGLQIISYEILTSTIFLIIFIIFGTVNFEVISDLQSNTSLFFVLPFLVINFFLATLMETNRPPFDLSEAESDVVAGYIVEYSGIIFGLFYLGEYINIFANTFFITMLFSTPLLNLVSFIKVLFSYTWLSL